jgi:hypothetical protein
MMDAAAERNVIAARIVVIGTSQRAEIGRLTHRFFGAFRFGLGFNLTPSPGGKSIRYASVQPPKRLAALLTKTEQLPVKDVERITTGGAREPATNRWKSAAEPMKIRGDRWPRPVKIRGDPWPKAHEDPW